MIRELRYTLIKNKDLEGAIHHGHLRDEDYHNLMNILEGVNRYREERNKESLLAVTIESDWPEYEPTWALLESRIFAQESYL